MCEDYERKENQKMKRRGSRKMLEPGKENDL